MSITLLLDDPVRFPPGIDSLASFRRWTLSDAFPQTGRIDYLAGEIICDMSLEDLHTHGILKTELVGVLWHRIKQDMPGELYSDRTRVSCAAADLSAEPDVVFVAEASLDSGRARLVPKASGAADRYVELEGSPDLIVEIVSDVSVAKDTQRLPVAYFRAGVTEFWLVDARSEPILFCIHRRGQVEYEPAEIDADGCQYSSVLRRWYRLQRRRNPRGRLRYDLLER